MRQELLWRVNKNSTASRTEKRGLSSSPIKEKCNVKIDFDHCSKVRLAFIFLFFFFYTALIFCDGPRTHVHLFPVSFMRNTRRLQMSTCSPRSRAKKHRFCRVRLTFFEQRAPVYPPRQAHTLGRTHRLPYRHFCSQRAGEDATADHQTDALVGAV